MDALRTMNHLGSHVISTQEFYKSLSVPAPISNNRSLSIPLPVISLITKSFSIVLLGTKLKVGYVVEYTKEVGGNGDYFNGIQLEPFQGGPLGSY